MYQGAWGMWRVSSCLFLALATLVAIGSARANDESSPASTKSPQPTSSAKTAEDTSETTEGAATSDGTADAEDGKPWIPGEFSGEVFLLSDYVDRGISNTDRKAALQGGISYGGEIGFYNLYPYVGFWGSNVDFDDDDEATVELDVLFGVSGAFRKLEWDIGGAYYTYPGADSDLKYDYWEIPVALSYPLYEGLTLNADYFYSPNFFGDTGQAHYFAAGLSYDIPLGQVTVTLDAMTGHQWIEDNERFGADDYQDFQVGLKVAYEGVEIGAKYTDTSLSHTECFGGTNICEGRAVFSLGMRF
jgi:uncharacterized protein (TIGR02001 family)